jgi:hypothetical protein
MKHLRPLLCLTFLLLPLPALADEMVSLKVGYMQLSPDGTFGATEYGLSDDIDLEDDVDLGKSEEVMLEAALQLGPVRLAAGYMPLRFSGTSTLSRGITFNGQTFSVNDTVKSNIDVDLYDVGLTWHILNFDDLPVRLQLGPEIAVKMFDAKDLSIRSETTGLDEDVSGFAAAPTIGARARVGFSDFIALIGRVGYSQYRDNTLLDADGQIEFSPIPLVGIFGGYRYLDFDIDESDILLNATFSGPYGGAFVRF